MLSAVLISGGVESAAQFLTVLVLFIVVLALTYFTTKFVGNYQKMQGFGKNIEAIETYRITGNKFLQIVRVGRKYYLLSIGKDEVNSIAELSEEELDLNTDTPAVNDRFKNMFEIAKDKMTKRGDNQ
ncbi:MAG: flagellar biosynthetic protein FliO [Lachnospiraceae bacterium]|nr:flagellar biosynthetic protein FliO [Lachnospiraceae bacterium]